MILIDCACYSRKPLDGTVLSVMCWIHGDEERRNRGLGLLCYDE